MKIASDEHRVERYKKIVALLLANDSFHKKDLYAFAQNEKPHFVGHVITELMMDGYLMKGGLKSRPSYSWTEKRKDFDSVTWVDQRVFTNAVKRSPFSDRPRERLLHFGPGQLKTSELIAILIRSGKKGESALQAGERIAARYGNDLRKLSLMSKGELKSISRAIGESAYCQIMAALELAKRFSSQDKADSMKPSKLRNPSDTLAYCRKHFERLSKEADQEEFHVILLDAAHQIVKTARITVGLTDKSLVHPREVMKPAIQESASALILVHNHPSGDPTPSRQDLKITKEMKSAADILGFQVLDHIILGKERSLSMAEAKLF